jgi:RHS repeat-associated protein
VAAVDENSMPCLETCGRRTQPLVDHLYQGMTLDAVTGLYYERNRDYSPALGRWMEQDPAQYINGANTYQFVDSSPVGNVDAEGTDFIALADHWIIATPLFHHYSIEYWKSCKNPPIGKVEYYSQFIAGHRKTRKKMQAVELEPYACLNIGLRGPAVVGNYNQVRLLQPPGYPGTEAVTVGTHFLAGIRRWYVMRMSSGSFLLLTEAYERPRGPVNKFMVDYSFLGKDFAFSIWDRELLNVAQFTENYVGGKMKWGKPVNHWATFEGQTNELDNPWISSLPQSLQPHPAGGG